MATLRDHVATAALSERCKCDLIHHVEQVELHDATLPKLPATQPCAQTLPSAVHATTVSHAVKTPLAASYAAATAAALSRDQAARDATRQAVCSRTCMLASTHTKPCKTRYRGYAGNDRVVDRGDVARGGAAYASCASMPFRDARRRDELSGPARCFAARYAAAVAKAATSDAQDVIDDNNNDDGDDKRSRGDDTTTARAAVSSLQQGGADDAATQAATLAYARAFRRYTHREPTPRELDDVHRLVFAFDERGRVGVVQRPHACYPHVHITSAPRYCVRCASQTYRPELPPLRAARDRFPGTVPVWSSTKNLHTLVATPSYATPPHGTQSNSSNNKYNHTNSHDAQAAVTGATTAMRDTLSQTR